MHLTASYKHLGIYHSGGGKLDVELHSRIAQTWATWRVVHRPLFTSRCLSKGIKIKLAYSLLMTRLLHGADTWPVLSRKQTKKIGTCYNHILRAATGELYRKDKPEEFKNDMAFLCAHSLPSIEICIAQKRLCYAARLQNHGLQLMEDILEAEDRLRDDSWLAALRGDVKWLIAVGGNAWGDHLEQLRANWTRKAGWKRFVKKAVRIHIMQEKIAYQIHSGHKAAGNVVVDLTSEHECQCGRTFRNSSSLAVHQWKEHGKHPMEYWAARTTVCQTCMREFWKRSRLQQHLSYIPRNGRANVCYTYQTKFCRTIDLEQDEEPSNNLPLKGINRREAIRLPRPLPLGIAKSDLAWAQKEKALKEEILEKEFQIDEIDSFFSSELENTLEKICSDQCQEDLGSLISYLESEGTEHRVVAVTMLLWGLKRSWSRTDIKEDWHHVLTSLPQLVNIY